VSKYAAFLRGINLGRRRRASGAELRSLFEQLGFPEVGSFRASGNVVFSANREPRSELTTRIEAGLARSLGFPVTVFLRTAGEVLAIADQQPFAPALVNASKGKLQVALLASKPSARTRREVLVLATDEDKLAFGDRELYWLPSTGTIDSELDFGAIEKLLGATTMRTKGTLDLLAAKHFAD
jgi:uncharacterized protein (DUF1697 family)